MRHTILPDPPRPDAPDFNLRTVEWMRRVKGILEDASRVNHAPLDTPIVVGTYSLTTSVDGSVALADLRNFVSTLVDAMTRRGLVSPTITRSQG